MEAIVVGGAVIFTTERETTVYFQNDLIADSQVEVALSQSRDADEPPNSYSVCLFFNGDMIACDHGASWDRAMAYIFHVLSSKTAEEAARGYGEIHPRFTADELIRRVRDPKWEAERAAQAAA